MKFIACYTNWGTKDGVFISPIDERPTMVNVQYIYSIEPIAPDVSRLRVESRNHPTSYYVAGDSKELAERIEREESATSKEST